MRRLGMLGLGVCLLLLPSTALATSIYSYTGPNFAFVIDNNPPAGTFTTLMNVSGSFEVAGPLASNLILGDITGSVLSYSFTDGRTVFTDANSSITNFDIGTDGAGTIDDWVVSFERGVPATIVGDQTQALGTQFTSDFGNVSECVSVGPGCSFSADNGIVNIPGAGVWTLVPEPSTGWLLALGLAGLAARRRRASA